MTSNFGAGPDRSEAEKQYSLEELGWNPADNRHLAGLHGEQCVPARIAREEKQLYLAYAAGGEVLAEVSGRFRNLAARESDYPKLGDWVALAPRWEEGRATIHALLPRRNFLSRKEPYLNVAEQILAANVDRTFIVCGLDRDFNMRRLERYLVMVFEAGIEPAIVLNKADLCEDVEARRAEVDAVAAGAPVFTVSALSGDGLDELRTCLEPGKTAAFVGSSGVGKSTIINAFLGSQRQAVNTLRAKDGRGRHTTVKRELIMLPKGGLVIDSPGLRELQLWADSAELGLAFSDIEEFARGCFFRDCRHENEPKCAVRAKLDSGELDRARYENYMKLQKETMRLERLRQDKDRRVAKAQARKTSKRPEDRFQERKPRRW